MDVLDPIHLTEVDQNVIQKRRAKETMLSSIIRATSAENGGAQGMTDLPHEFLVTWYSDQKNARDLHPKDGTAQPGEGAERF